MCRAGIQTTVKAHFTLLLEAGVAKGQVWDIPVVLNDDGSTIPILRFLGMKPRGGGAGAEPARFALEFEALASGSCTVELVLKRPWKSDDRQQRTVVVDVSVSEDSMHPTYHAVVKACTQGYRRNGRARGRAPTPGSLPAYRLSLREAWQRQPLLRELRRHPLLSFSASRRQVDFDALIAAFERHVELS